jgi:hypothetical protein
VTLSGTLVVEERVGYLLRLPKPICVEADPTTPLYSKESKLREIQVSGTSRVDALLSESIGKQVTLVGTLKRSLDNKWAPTSVILSVGRIKDN